MSIYKGFSSTRAESVAILNDLYVQLQHRAKGFGKILMGHALGEAKVMGYTRLQWLTAQHSATAQKL